MYESDYDAERRKFLCKQWLWWLDTELQLCIETLNLLGDSKTKQMYRQQKKSKKLLQLCMFFSKLQLVCTWAPVTWREVCPRLLQSKTLHTKYNLRNLPPNLHDSKHPIFPLQQKSNKSQPKDPQWYQHKDQLYSSLDGGWSEVSLCKASRIRVFPRNAVMERKILKVERKIDSPSTSLIYSAEQNSSLKVF